MALRAVDEQHFYIDEQLIDLVWIGHRARKQITAGNYHEMSRSLNWLNKLARRLLANEAEVTERDEAIARERLGILGFDWYFK